ncbi:MAG: Nre family DNA repair protein [Nitrososphaerales archaeon]
MSQLIIYKPLKGYEWTKDEWLKDLKSVSHDIKLAGEASSLCLICKGGRMLCGKLRCPIIAKARSLIKSSSLIPSERVEGSTPPGAFVGQIGYPKVYVGPMLPPYFGDTGILDTPELWIGKSIDEIIDYRLILVRGKIRMHIYDAFKGNRSLDLIQELSMGISPIDSEAIFEKRPIGVISLSEDAQPFGPSSKLKSFKTSIIRVDRRIEKAYYDRDMNAFESVINLYNDGVLVSRIQRVFSVGMLGIGNRRRLVPTRWSITAVDSMISLWLIKEIKQYDSLDEYEVYYFRNLDNIFLAILMPEKWSFEWIEAWFPGTVWNAGGKTPTLMGDYEGYMGRSTYAEVGGCYYSARLAVAEKLKEMKKQAKVLVLREIHPDYILPIGVWNVRESVRRALRGEPMKFDSLKSALGFARKILTIPLDKWIENSVMLKSALFQRKITDF